MRERIFGFLGFLIVRSIGLTLRVKTHFPDDKTAVEFQKRFANKDLSTELNYLLAFWHQDELCLLNYWRKRNLSVLISISKDGEIMNRLAQNLGYKPVRGSSSKRAVSGLIAAIRKVKVGYTMAFAVDGPRGPIYQVKEGICAISNKTKTPIVPVRAFCSHVKIFEKSWNKAKFPLPFARVDLVFGPIKHYDTSDLQTQLNALSAPISSR